MKIDKNQFEKDAVREFDTRYSNSIFWDITNYPKNYYSIKDFIKKIVKETEGKTTIFCLEQYDEFLKESETENLRNPKKRIKGRRNKFLKL